MGISKEMKNFHSASNLQKLYLNDSVSDVQFIFDHDGISQPISAHKCLLAIASPVFQRMFYGDLKEGDTVHIIDATSEAFIEFLQFFYLDKITLNDENVAEVMTLADKYDVRGCLNLCAQFLELTLSATTAAWYYELATSFNLNYLAGLCEEKICVETKCVFKSETFLHCTQSILREILRMEHLSCDEIDVFEASMNWAIEACKLAKEEETIANQKEHLGDCFELIRFPTMTTEDFSKCAERGVFDGNEMLDLLRYLTIHQELRVATKYPRKAREGAPAWTSDDTICICDRRSQMQLCRSADIQKDVLVFTVNERILLGQLSLSIFTTDSKEESDDNTRTGLLTIKHGSNGIIILTQTIHISSQSHSKVQLAKTIVVSPFEEYEIETEWQLEPSDELVLRTECRPEIMLDGGIRFQFKSRDGLDYNNVTEGLISKLYFKKY